MSVLAFIIEDDEDLSTIFADALETVGYQVEQIKDGLKAQQRLKEKVPFMILHCIKKSVTTLKLSEKFFKYI